MSLPLHSHREQNRLKPGEPLPLDEQRRGTTTQQNEPNEEADVSGYGWWCRCVVVAVVCVFSCAPSYAEEPIKIGFLYPFSGAFQAYGAAARKGAELAIDDINRNGGLLGRPVVAVFDDTELTPITAMARSQKLVKDDKVDVVMGVVSSAVALWLSPALSKMGVPLIVTLAMTPDITGEDCTPYTFRVSLNTSQVTESAAAIASTTAARTWTTIGPDYVYGYQSWEYFQAHMKESTPSATFAAKDETVYVPLKTSNLAPYVGKLLRTDADGILVSLYGVHLLDFVRRGMKAGLFDGKREIVMTLACSQDTLGTLGREMPEGLWVGGPYWFLGNKTPANERFVEEYRSRFKEGFPDHNVCGAYSGVQVYAAAVRRAGTVGKQEVARALEGLTVDLPVGKVTLRAKDHQAVYDAVWGKTAGYSDKWGCRLLKPLMIFDGQGVSRTVAETGCETERETRWNLGAAGGR